MTTSKQKQKHKLLPLVIYNPLIPVKGFLAMVTIFILWIRSEHKGDTRRLNERFFRHETIHVYQQTEIWITSIIIAVLSCLIFNLSLWWILATPLLPLLIYVICWIIEIILPPYNMAYKNICFETEARYNENNPEYLNTRKLFQFKFLKYISNKKYPAK